MNSIALYKIIIRYLVSGTQRKSTEVPPTLLQPSGVVEQSIKTAGQTPLVANQHQNTQSGIQQIWASQEQAADTGRITSSLASRMTQAEPVPIQTRPSNIDSNVAPTRTLPAEQPVNSQQRSLVVAESTPFPVRPGPAEPAPVAPHVNVRTSQVDHTNGGFSQMRRQSSQPMYEQSNVSANSTR